eukprot:2340183-Amphidinium_carterae.1
MQALPSFCKSSKRHPEQFGSLPPPTASVYHCRLAPRQKNVVRFPTPPRTWVHDDQASSQRLETQDNELELEQVVA